MNKAIFIGRVGGDAELRYTPQGKAVASFSMALDNGKDGNGNKREPTWIKATMWESRAEKFAQYITKGKLVYVSGPVGAEAWTDKNSGDAKAKITVTVHEFEFCGGGKDEDGEQQSPNPNAPSRQNHSQVPPSDDYYAGTQITDDDIPF
jgi:single-strand DNA-binding protein